MSANLAKMRFLTLRHDHFHHDHGSCRIHGAGDVGQQRAAPIVVPIVDDVLQQVAVAAFRHRREEVSAHAGDAPAQGVDAVPIEDARKIEQRALVLYGLQDRSREGKSATPIARAVSTARLTG